MEDKKPTTYPHLRIENGTIQGRRTRVYLNGTEISNVLTEVDVHFGVDGTVTASLTYVIGHLDIDAQAEILASVQSSDESGLTDTTALGSKFHQFAITDKEKARESWKCPGC